MKKDKPLVRKLEIHADGRGFLFELCRNSWRPEGETIKQVYLTSTRPNVVKAFHLHKKQADWVVCVKGSIMLKLIPLSTLEKYKTLAQRWAHLKTILKQTKTIFLSENDLKAVRIPPNYLHGWKNIGTEDAWVINAVSEEYDGSDEFRESWNLDGMLDWETQNG